MTQGRPQPGESTSAEETGGKPSARPWRPNSGAGAPSRGWVECLVGEFALETDWEIEPGQVQVLFGPSGAGKTTTLRSIAGLLRPQRGHIEIGGRVVYDATAGVWVPSHRRRVGYLTQQYHLFPHLTVAGNIAYGLPRSVRLGPAGRDRVKELMQALHLEGLEERRTWEMSGGQQQRVALGRALAPNPRLLLLDEPFASLDAELRRALRRELRSMLAASPIPVLLVTHDREEALALGDSVQVLDAGKPIARGAPLEVLGQPGRGRVAALVGVENLFRLQVVSRNALDGTMMCVGYDLRLEVPLEVPLEQPTSGTEAHAAQGDAVTVGIRASDIILAAEEPRGSSARNRLHGVVTGVEPSPPGYEVTMDCGRPLRCHITGASLAEMGIRPGLPLWAVFKASSCFLVDES